MAKEVSMETTYAGIPASEVIAFTEAINYLDLVESRLFGDAKGDASTFKMIEDKTDQPKPMARLTWSVRGRRSDPRSKSHGEATQTKSRPLSGTAFLNWLRGPATTES